MIDKKDDNDKQHARLKSLNLEKRKQEQKQIYQDNLRILNKITKRKSEYSKNELDK